MNETEVLMKFIAECAYALPHVRLFRRNIVNQQVERGGRHFHAKAGEKGQADAYALVEGGLHVEIEAKAAKGRLRDEQEGWRARMLAMRVPYLILRILPGEHPDATVERWIGELRAVVVRHGVAA